MQTYAQSPVPTPDNDQLVTAYNIVTHPVLHANMQGSRIWAWKKLMAARGKRVDTAQLKAFARRSQMHSVQFSGATI